MDGVVVIVCGVRDRCSVIIIRDVATVCRWHVMRYSSCSWWVSRFVEGIFFITANHARDDRHITCTCIWIVLSRGWGGGEKKKERKKEKKKGRKGDIKYPFPPFFLDPPLFFPFSFHLPLPFLIKETHTHTHTLSQHLCFPIQTRPTHSKQPHTSTYLEKCSSQPPS